MLQRRKTNQVPVIKINGKIEAGLNETNRIPKHETLRVTISDENDFDESINSSQTTQKKTATSRIKLKDYLFLAQTSFRKKAAQKRRILQNLSSSRTKAQSQLSKIAMKQQAQYLKKNKYGIKNSEMFEILKREVESQVRSSVEQIDRLSNQLNTMIKDYVVPSNGEMMMMYKLRTLFKEKVKNCLKQMKQAIQKQKTQRTQGVQIQILIDQQQLKRDIGFTQEMFSRKYLEIEGKLDHNDLYIQ